MNPQSARSVNAVSVDELQRRWRACVTRMQQRGIDALVLQNSSDWVGGYIRWFSNQPATNGYPSSLVFPLDGGMSLIEQGPFGGVHDAAAEPRAARHRHRPPADHAELPLGALHGRLRRRPRNRGTAGAGRKARRPGGAGGDVPQLRPAPARSARAGCELVDATDMVDRIKAIKSAEERALIRAGGRDAGSGHGARAASSSARA